MKDKDKKKEELLAELAGLRLAIVRDISERKQAGRDLARRDYQLEILSRTSQHINAVLEIPVIMRTLIAAAMELVDATGGSAGIFTNGKMEFSEQNIKGKLEAIKFTCIPDDNPCGCISQDSKPYISNDAEHDPKINPEARKVFKFYNFVGIPIHGHKAELLGCFQIFNKKDRQPFDTQDAFMLQGLAASAAVALENAKMLEEQKKLHNEILRSNKKLKQLVLKDPQTGLYNHRYLAEVIEPEFYRARRYGHPLSVLMLDIDYFKSINDVYGHQFGDTVLKQFAAYIKRMVRRYDIVIRFGGEEFIIISPGVARDKALVLAQRLQDAVNLYNFGDDEHIVKLKLSISTASYPDDKITRAMDLINLADKILDKVKQDGGNRVYSSLNMMKEKQAVKKAADYSSIKSLQEKIEKLTKRGNQSLVESIFAFAKTIELKDHYTGEHVEDTVHYSTEIAKALEVSPEEIENIKKASILHDLGKVGISDKILHKKSRLSKIEYEEIKKHPQIAADIIRPIQFMHDIIPLILYHHEKWDGKGYPAGLKGDEIPIGARIIAIADVYQALTSDRPYRKAYPKEKAMRMIKKSSGTQFDPSIVDVFLRILKKEK